MQFGPFVFDRARQLLTRDGQEVPLPPRVLGVLDVLTAQAGQIVSKQELIETVWKDAFVSDTSLTEAISFLRQVLADDPQQPSYIQTVHRRGYRFLAPAAEALPASPAVLESAAAPHEASFAVLPWAIAVLLSAIAGSALWRLAHPDAPALPPVARFDLAAPPGTAFNAAGSALALSADGSRLAFAACGADGCRIFERRLDETEAHAVAGTEGGTAPFLSPDGSMLGFFADGKLKKVAATGGTAIVLAEVRQPFGAEWTDEGSIVFSGSSNGGPGGLMRVAAEGTAAPTTLYQPDGRRGELALAWPQVLPGGRLILATAIGAFGQPPLTSIIAISTATAERTAIVDRALAARFVAPGTLVFVRDGQLTAAAFDASQRKIVGQPVALPWRVADSAPQFAVSSVGSFAVVPSVPERAGPLAFVAGRRVVPLPANVQHLTSASLSADGRRLAALAAHDVRADIWAADIDRGALTRLTYEGEHRAPFWRGDARSVVYAARGGGVFNLFVRSLDGSAPRRIAPAPHQQIPSAVAPDGTVVTYTQFDPETGADIWIAPLEGGRASVAVRTPFDETAGTLSADDRFLAYQSNESNRWEIYVRPLSARGAPVSISTEGGTSPVWSRDGRTIFYTGAAGVMAVDVQRDGCEGESPCDLAPSRPAEILHGPWTARGTTPDGRVLVERLRDRELSDHIVVTLQWTRELQRLVPPPVVSSPK